jgi:hypothetical protein
MRYRKQKIQKYGRKEKRKQLKRRNKCYESYYIKGQKNTKSVKKNEVLLKVRPRSPCLVTW